MKIIPIENNKLRILLFDAEQNKMLFDFVIKREDFTVFRDHVIEHLREFNVYENETRYT